MTDDGRYLGDGIVYLRPVDARDTVYIHRACQDGRIARFIPNIPVPYILSDAQHFVARATVGWETYEHLTWAVERPDDETFCGVISLTINERPATLGYWVASRMRAQGSARRAVRAVVTWLQNRPDRSVDHVIATMHPQNHASIHAITEAGFTFVRQEEGSTFRDKTDQVYRYEWRRAR